MSGVHALLRAPLDTVRRDASRGRRTAGVVCGYRGSPLGTVDLTFAAHEAEFAAHDIRFVNGVNEDLAATVLWGTQRSQQEPTSTVDGVVGLWYAKAPGLDRSGDALRHANLSGVPPTGGVLAAVGDDPECKSSTVPSSTEWTLADLAMPALAAATVQEVLDLGRHGYELSRRSGSWVGLKLHSDVADGYATVDVGRPMPEVAPYERDGRRWAAHLDDRMFAPWSMLLEEEAVGARLDAVHHYVRGAGLDVVHGDGAARLGILAAGKTYGDVVSALTDLGIELGDLPGLGIRVLKPALVWPLEPTIVRAFAAGLHEIVVVEEKRAFLEEQVKSLLYGTADAPVVTGKRDPDGGPLVPSGGVLDVTVVAEALRSRLAQHLDPARLRPARARIVVAADLPARTPYFCSGCPHNRSTVVPEGSVAGGGIGCHGMALFTRDRATGTTQMGGEGAQWVGASLFSSEPHRFQNMGDGTLAHSGFLAVRQAVAAGTTVTFKILANGVVAMTGGQHAAGSLSIPALTRQLEAEGVRRIDVISDEPGRYGRAPGFAPGVRVHGRKQLDAVQRELRDTTGVTALIYDQACAAELRRERKRGRAPTPRTRVMINEAVCEGCGHCGDVSNCLSVHPVDTPFGRKTRIHQDSCNLDMSCIEGDCPAFVTVTPRRSRGPARREPGTDPRSLPEPSRPASAALLVAGIGGTGVVTVGQVLSTAANLDGLEVSSVDQTGMAQKGGPVVSHLRIGTRRHRRRGPARGGTRRRVPRVRPADRGRARQHGPPRPGADAGRGVDRPGADRRDGGRRRPGGLPRPRDPPPTAGGAHARVRVPRRGGGRARHLRLAAGGQPGRRRGRVPARPAPPVGVGHRTGDRAQRRRGGDEHRRLPAGTRDRDRPDAGRRGTARRTSRFARGGRRVVRTRRRGRPARRDPRLAGARADRIPGRRLRGALRRRRRPGPTRRARGRRRRERLRPYRRAQPLPPDGVQGRVRGRPAAPPGRVPRRREGRVRWRCRRHLPPATADRQSRRVAAEGPGAGPRGAACVLGADQDGEAARHPVRPVRPDCRTARRASAHPRLRHAGRRPRPPPRHARRRRRGPRRRPGRHGAWLRRGEAAQPRALPLRAGDRAGRSPTSPNRDLSRSEP